MNIEERRRRLAESRDRVERLMAERRPTTAPAHSTPYQRMNRRGDRLSRMLAAQQPRCVVELAITPASATPMPAARLERLIAVVTAAGATMRLRRLALRIERRGEHLRPLIVSAIHAYSHAIAELIAAHPCSDCGSAVGRIEPTPDTPAGAQHWRIACRRCARILRTQ